MIVLYLCLGLIFDTIRMQGHMQETASKRYQYEEQDDRN